jgi:hypothetical protein
MPLFSGQSRRLSLTRRLVADYMHISRNLPRATMERRMAMRPLVAARAASGVRPSWYAILAKAFATVAARHPVLRSAYLRYPWPRIYEHPRSVAAVVVEREVRGESTPFIAPMASPDTRTLVELHAGVRRYQERPLHEIGAFRRALMVARMPFPLRRLVWWLGNDWLGTQRARFFGTFGISLTSSLGATLVHMVSPWTTTLHAGPIAADGSMPLRVWFDHRLLDGAPMARILREVEEVLLGQIVLEVRSLPCSEAA